MGSVRLCKMSLLWAGIALLLLAAVDARPPASKVDVCHGTSRGGVFARYEKLSIAEQGWSSGHAKEHAEDCYLDPERTLPGTRCPVDRIDGSCSCLDGRSGPLCKCTAGDPYNGATGNCDEINACISFPCSSNGGATICTDILASAGGRNDTQGRTCACSSADTQVYANDTAGCVDIDACISFPCSSNGGASICTDITGGFNDAEGRTCTCSSAAQFYANDTAGCVDIDACISFPCSSNGGASICTDITGGSNDTQGRTCTCSSAAQFYADDTAGCVDIDACISFPCSSNGGASICTDITGAPNSAQGRTCTCSAATQSYISDTVGCVDRCAGVTCGAPPNVCTLNTCNSLTGQCALSPVSCPISPGPSTSVVRITQSQFAPGTGVITFSEKALGTNNPTYTPSNYGATSANAPTVTLAGWFQGQALSANPSVACPGGNPSGCVGGTPTSPLSLALGSPVTFITSDIANPTSPVLSGSPTFNGPVAVLFSTPVVGFGLDGGFFDAAGSTAITAFNANGQALLTVTNTRTGIEFLGLATNDGSPLIKGVLFSLVGAEPAGFAIDNVRFTYRCCG